MLTPCRKGGAEQEWFNMTGSKEVEKHGAEILEPPARTCVFCKTPTTEGMPYTRGGENVCCNCKPRIMAFQLAAVTEALGLIGAK